MRNIDLSNQRVLVTGATGFLGSRLVEKLIIDHNARVRVIIRNFNKAARIARFGIEIIKGDVTDPDNVDSAVKDCDIVIHCAWSYSDKHNEKETKQSNIEGLKNILRAAEREKVKRTIFVSSQAVYPDREKGYITEDSARRYTGNVYPDTKLRCEEIVRSFSEKGVPVVTVQPTTIYGPWSTIWTVNPLMRLKKMYLALDDGEGLCNAVYVDDVVEALVLASVKEKAVGETFLISGEEPARWKDFYGAYEKMLGVNSLVYKDPKTLKAHIRWQKFFESGVGKLLFPIRQVLREYPLMVKGYLLFKTSVGQVEIKKEDPRKPTRMPNEVIFKILQAKAIVKIDKAKRLLDYQPAFDFERGMAMTETWAKWANLL
ncbi:MAG: NAD-dependent epimerase/dehydratase family protein [Candidatus Omnitrophica bacterium]|nr:NAD-dependent epimerase/dehydratase family protein [Candidatus Omnitrophota bacterium]